MDAGHDQNISSAARQLLEADMQARLAVVDELAQAQNEEDDLAARLEEVQQRHTTLYAEAERRGWTPQQLKKLGLRPPQRRAPGRPRGKSPAPKKNRPATAGNSGQPDGNDTPPTGHNEQPPSGIAPSEPVSTLNWTSD